MMQMAEGTFYGQRNVSRGNFGLSGFTHCMKYVLQEFSYFYYEKTEEKEEESGVLFVAAAAAS